MRKNWVVLKFGGTSVANGNNWKNIAKIVKDYSKKGLSPILVCSALSKVSNILEDLPKKSLDGNFESYIDELKKIHLNLAIDLELSDIQFINDYLISLKNLLHGIYLTQESSSRLKAEILSYGEILSTKIGNEFLKKSGISSEWIDARAWLKSVLPTPNSSSLNFLSNKCEHEKDHQFQEELQKYDVVITQGFICSNNDNKTVLLGRGGSDTSAAYITAKIEAERCEIWTDVPGMFTTDPYQIPEAYLLKTLHYEEAQEMAGAGSKVLHPKCLEPLKEKKIPMHIKSLMRPDLEGTIIQGHQPKKPQIKGICLKKDIQVISLETMNMWNEVGFLSKFFQILKDNDLSVDLVSTSASQITVTLDKSPASKNPKIIYDLLSSLNKLGKVQYNPSMVSVSFVGTKIRSILHKLTPIFKQLEEKKISLVSQSSNNLNLTLVMKQEDILPLLPTLHNHLFQNTFLDATYGPKWKDINQKNNNKIESIKNTWWITEKAKLINLSKNSTPLYIYKKSEIKNSIKNLKSIKSVNQFFYAVKANNHKDVLETIYDEKLGFECVSLNEVDYILKLFPNISPNNILFTPNFIPKKEFEKAFDYGINITLDNCFPLEHWPEVFREKTFFLRLDPSLSGGHHEFVQTSGVQSKFGIALKSLPKVKKIIEDLNCHVKGLHSHIGSGIFSKTKWQESAKFLIMAMKYFPTAKILDLGGGLGVPERFEQDPVDLKISTTLF